MMDGLTDITRQFAVQNIVVDINNYIFVSRILWLLRAAGHGEAFCPGQRDIPIGNRVYVGRDIRRRAP